MNKSKEKPQTELLAKLFSNFTEPKPVPFIPTGSKTHHRLYMLGSKAFTKIIMFANEVQLNNNDVDYWCHQNPKRNKDESYESYKQRLKFTRLLDKYRSYLFQYPIIEKKHSTKRAKKVMKQLNIN